MLSLIHGGSPNFKLMKSRNQLLTIFYLLIFSGIGFAQITYYKTYGDWSGERATTLIQTSDGGFITAGYTGSFGAAGYADCYIIKTDFFGDTLWTKTYGTLERDYPSSILQTSDGGYVFAGSIQNNATIDHIIYAMRTDSIGNILWNKTYIPVGSNSAWSRAILPASDGGYVIGGTTHFTAGYEDPFLLKIDTNGTVFWSKTYGGIYFDAGYSFKETNDGGYVIVGFTGNFGVGSSDIYLIKTDTVGAVQWSKTYGGINQDVGLSIQQTLDNGYIIAGYTQSFGAGNRDIYLIKTDINGNTQWSKAYGGTNSDMANYVQQTIDGGYILGGTTQSFGAGVMDVYLVKTDSFGDTLWTKAIGDTAYDYCNVVQETIDGGYIVAGSRNDDAYLVKTDANGNSGCNESSTNTIVTSPSTQTTNPATIENTSSILSTNSPFSVGNGGIITAFCFSDGIPEPLDNDIIITIYPNPFRTSATIIFNSELRIQNAELTMYDVMGREVLKLPIINYQLSIIRGNLKSGMYFCKVTGDKGQGAKEIICTGKIIAE